MLKLMNTVTFPSNNVTTSCNTTPGNSLSLLLTIRCTSKLMYTLLNLYIYSTSTICAYWRPPVID